MLRRIVKVLTLGRLEPGPKRIPVRIPGDDVIKTAIVCDACGVAAAKFRATNFRLFRTLCFCAAHLMKHQKALLEQGWEIGKME
jgi:hypothetical protein